MTVQYFRFPLPATISATVTANTTGTLTNNAAAPPAAALLGVMNALVSDTANSLTAGYMSLLNIDPAGNLLSRGPYDLDTNGTLSTAVAGAGNTVTADVDGYSAISMYIPAASTLVGTVTIESSPDEGTTWIANPVRWIPDGVQNYAFTLGPFTVASGHTYSAIVFMPPSVTQFRWRVVTRTGGSCTAHIRASSVQGELLTRGQYALVPPTLNDQDIAPLSLDATGNLRVSLAAQPLNTLTVAGNLTHNAAVPGATNIGALTAVANIAAPSFTETYKTLLSVNLGGALRTINEVQLPTALGAQVTTASLAVNIASDQTVKVKGGLTNNNAAPAASSLVANMPAVANAADPTITEGNLSTQSMDLKGYQRTRSKMAGTATVTSQANITTAGGQIAIAANANRLGFMLANTGTGTVYVLLGAGTVSSSNFSFALTPASGSPANQFVMKGEGTYTGQVQIIGSNSNGNTVATELT